MRTRSFVVAIATVLLVACGSSRDNGNSPSMASTGGSSSLPDAGGGYAAGSPTAGGGVVLDVNPMSNSGGAADGSQVIATLPNGFQPTDIGGYLLGANLAAGGSNGGSGTSAGGNAGAATGGPNGNCGNILLGVARDFQTANQPGANPDFESRAVRGMGVTPQLVASNLGVDAKPVYASSCETGNPSAAPVCPFGAQTTTQTNFDQWYRDTPGVNQPFLVSLYLAPQPGGLFTFQSLHYFPLDGAGYGASGRADDGMMHNFSFTTEIHTQFAYGGGETFEFQGDDDVWVFVNGKLAVDLGGLHPRATGTLTLDSSAAALGLEKGKVYALDLFHAERHTDKSTFRIDTNLSFVNCGTVEVIPR